MKTSEQKYCAVDVLRAAHRRRPSSPDVLRALVESVRERGDIRAAAGYAAELVALTSEDGGARALAERLRREAGMPGGAAAPRPTR